MPASRLARRLARSCCDFEPKDRRYEPALHSPVRTFAIGGDLSVSRIGFGARHIAARPGWGKPADRAAMIGLLRPVPNLGINLNDTADSYGPDVSEQLIREALTRSGTLILVRAATN